MKTLIGILAAGVLVSCAHAKTESTPEEAFAACLSEKQPDMIAAVRDAQDEKAFLAAMKVATQVCPANVEKMSMGKLFDALNAYRQEKD